MQLEKLISQIQSLDGTLKHEANKAVNRLLTMRNWLIGYYIVEYEQKGEDRAKYGDTVLQNIAAQIDQKGLSFRNLQLFRQFFLVYPSIGQILSAQLMGGTHLVPKELLNSITQIVQTMSAQLQTADNQPILSSSKPANTLENNYTLNVQTVSAELENNVNQIRQTLSDESTNSTSHLAQIKPTPSVEAILNEKIISKLSFSHITLLLPIDNEFKRAFYAIEAIKGTWSVRELKRQIESLLFERSGMSKKPEQLLSQLDTKVEKQVQTSFVKDIYTFEFLGLPATNAVEESDLETALLDHLQQFLIELGHGFCLEARQKRILIGDEYFFIDLVFYHRILKCHVLIDLKVEAFDHNNAGQLNTYINYYKKEMLLPGDNPPVGILLVTKKNDALVEYATAGMDEQLFVRKYLLELPDKREIAAFLTNELKNL